MICESLITERLLMDQLHKRGTTAAFLQIIILCLFFIFVSTSGDDKARKSFDHERKQEQEDEVKKSACEMMKGTFAFYTSSPWSPIRYLDKLKTFLNLAQAYFFPPNLDFSGSKAAEEMKERSEGEKVKEAAVKSLERSKESLEESAKTAAQIAGNTIHKTKAKVKKTFSPEL